jgi:tellurium resistance protein TerD
MLNLGTDTSAPLTTAINLSKGQRINLSKDNPTLKRIRVFLEWAIKEGKAADLDASAVLLGTNDKMIPGVFDTTYDGKPELGAPRGLVYYRSKNSFDGSVVSSGDNLVGGGDGETLIIDLSKVSADTARIWRSSRSL